MSKKIYDLCVAGDKYSGSDGHEKTKWLNVGAVIEKDDGGKFILLERTFSPAGVANPENKNAVIISMFAPKDKTVTEQVAGAFADQSPF